MKVSKAITNCMDFQKMNKNAQKTVQCALEYVQIGLLQNRFFLT